VDIDLILSLALAGAVLGVVEGIKPGPLLTMVIRETLSGGLRAGIWTAAAPVFTDGPLIVLSLVAAAWIATQTSVLLAITIAGAIFLAYMGIECFSLELPDMMAQAAPPKASFLRGITTNLLNPGVYVFWFLIGGPLMASAVDQEVLAPVAYALSFLGTIIMTKVCIAYLISKSSQGITPQTYRNLLSVCALVMLCFSLYYVWQAYSLIAG
jgi:threonine/homoserine/homoserine lactone efflux protein